MVMLIIAGGEDLKTITSTDPLLQSVLVNQLEVLTSWVRPLPLWQPVMLYSRNSVSIASTDSVIQVCFVLYYIIVLHTYG